MNPLCNFALKKCIFCQWCSYILRRPPKIWKITKFILMLHMLFQIKLWFFTNFVAFSEYTNCRNFLTSSQAPAPNAQFFSLIHFKSPHAWSRKMANSHLAKCQFYHWKKGFRHGTQDLIKAIATVYILGQ